ncbi:Zinc finger protein 771 [Frankliniella fusca]|uniref:Zinc finger protein 771 n=1 Tax=Frankliniella fusca TaxID=407009 RepID=A0AAE1LBD5_9NEOP|nr:Zinc finger protein 771 [Frankliniella fusca]
MVNCSIDGCKSRVGRDKISFYGIPAVLTRQCELTMELSERRRKCWFERIYRSSFDEANLPRYTRVCANHFVTGKPSALFDVANADWAPSLNLGETSSCLTRSKGKGYQKQSKMRRKKQERDEGPELSCEIKIEPIEEDIEENILNFTSNDVPGTGCQTEISWEGFTRLEEMYKKVLEENIAMRKELESLKSLVREPSDEEDPLAISDNEGSSSGLEKVEVILKTEPDPEIETDSNPVPEDSIDPLAYNLEVNNGVTPSARSQSIRQVYLYAGEVTDNTDPKPNQNCLEDDEPESDDLNIKSKKPVRPQKRTKKFPCPECGQKFISNQALEIHVRIHTGERPFECAVCQKGFSVASTLKAHMRTHTGERPYACQLCPRRFSEHGTLKCHMRTHTGEKPYECDVCHKKFSENSTLRRHLLTHTGERPFECETCHSKFIQKYNLNNHIRRVHIGAAVGL